MNVLNKIKKYNNIHFDLLLTFLDFYTNLSKAYFFCCFPC